MKPVAPFMKPVALITGASSGIGETFARTLAVRGYDLILVARRADRLQALAATLPASVQVVAADLALDEGLVAVEQAIGACPRLEMLVNNAGFGTLGYFWEADIAGQDQMHRVHILATVRLTHAALKGMVARGKGAVINVSSVAAFSVNPGNVSYCATKAWMNNFSEGLDLELRSLKSPVKVQALCPGFTLTEFHDTLGVDRGGIPGWLWMKAEDVVAASLKGLERGRVVVVPGWPYKAAVTFLRYLPPWIRRRVKRPFRDKRP
jgi:short-subunit dehydrogenase